MNYLVYLIAIIFGIMPIKISSILKAYILSIVLDEFRFLDISFTNILLSILVFKFLINFKRFIKLTQQNIFFILFGIIVFISFILNYNSAALKNFISLFLLIISSFFISLLVSENKYRLIITKFIMYMSLITGFSVIIDSLLYYIFRIQLHESLFSLMNLSQDFYFSSGFFTSNGIASFHIIPGLVILLFGNKEDQKYRAFFIAILILSLTLTMTRGGILVGLIIGFILLLKYLKNATKLIKTLGYGVLIILTILAANLIVFISYFNISSVVARLYIINGALNSIKNKPLFGSGLAAQVTSSETNFDLVDINQVQESVLNDTTLRETHNTFLQIGVETGLLGLASILILIISTVIIQKKIINNLNFDLNSRDYHYVSYMMLSLFIVFVNMNSYLYLKLFWLIIASFSSINNSIINKKDYNRYVTK